MTLGLPRNRVLAFLANLMLQPNPCRAAQVLDHLQLNDPVLHLAMELEKIALTDDFFVKRNLYPNVDFYSGICLRAIGVPVSMFTVLFAVVSPCTGLLNLWSFLT